MIRRFLVGLLAIVGAVSLVMLLAVGGGAWWWIDTFGEPEPLPDRIVLTVTL
ncbi:MAG: hypothetical protein HQ477_08955, partial [Chloroflexi bacterium]|nr:hypothetical protein [Chloroflexota bacterium]